MTRAMNELHAMKGSHEKLITVATAWTIVDLISFADGSLGVLRGEQLMGIWEPHEQEACIASFIQVVTPSYDPEIISELSSVLLRACADCGAEICTLN